MQAVARIQLVRALGKRVIGFFLEEVDIQGPVVGSRLPYKLVQRPGALRHQPRPRHKEKGRTAHIARRHENHQPGPSTGDFCSAGDVLLQQRVASETDHVIAATQHQNRIETLISFQLGDDVGKFGTIARAVDNFQPRMLTRNQASHAVR